MNTHESTHEELRKQNAELAVELALFRPEWEIEMTGSWVWVGNTSKEDEEGRAILRDGGFKWSRKKGKWYLKGASCRRTKRDMDMAYIRKKYGSHIYTNGREEER